MTAKPSMQELAMYIDSIRGEVIEFWRNMVNYYGMRYEHEHMAELAEYMKTAFEGAGMEVELVPTYEGVAPYLYGVYNKESTEKGVVFSGHYDTVFNKGHFGENPFTVEGNIARGPGVLDMKGGIAISFAVAKALKHFGFDACPVKVFYFSDEEGLPVEGKMRPKHLFAEKCSGARVGLNMETGLPGDRLCIGRKSASIGEVTVTGVAAHAGANFKDGKNAIEQMAHLIPKIQALTDLERGLTVSCGLISGGVVHNSVPDLCKISIDIRFLKNEDGEWTKKQIEEICKVTYVEGTNTKFKYIPFMPAYETTDEILKLFEFVKAVSEDVKPTIKEGVVLGGASDASLFGAAGIPALCSCGVVGNHNHAPAEYAEVESIFDRAKLYTNMIYRIDEFEG